MAQHDGIIVKHTADKMKAYVALAKNFGQYDAGTVLTELLQHGIVHGLNAEVVRRLAVSGMFDRYVEVAAGTPVKPGVDGRIEILQNLPPAGAHGEKGENGEAARPQPVEFIKVKAGALLAQRVPPVQGVNGMDVFGSALLAPHVKDARLLGGRGTVAMSDNPDRLLAKYDGTFYRKPSGEMEVRPFMKIDGDVGNGMGRVEFDGDILIEGSVAPDVSVEVTGALVIRGSVHDAAIKCGGDLALHSAVLGGSKSIIRCGGSVWAGSVERTAMSAEGGIAVESAVNCDITCNGVFRAVSITGGSVTAAGGVSADRIGSSAGARTVVDVSTMHDYVKKIESIKSDIEHQNVLSDKCISVLYRYVRDNMDDSGEMRESSVMILGDYVNSLRESILLGDGMEKNLAELSAELKAIVDCKVVAREVYPNVQIKLGFSEQNVKEVMKNVLLKPAAVEVGEKP